MSDIGESVDRVSEHLRQFSRLRDTGGVIQTTHSDPDKEAAELLASDLTALINYILNVAKEPI